MSWRSGFVLTTLLLVIPALRAQESVTPGMRVKVKMDRVPGILAKTAEVRGMVVSTTGDTLFLELEPGTRWSKSGSPTFAVPRDGIIQLSVSRGRGPQPLAGAAYGGIGGVMLGLSVLTLLCGEEDIEPGPGEGDKNTCTLSDVGSILFFTAILGVGGAVGGLVVGTIFGGERWQGISTDRWRLSVHRGAAGSMGAGLSLSF